MRKMSLYAIVLSTMLCAGACTPNAQVWSPVSESESIVITEGTDSQLSANSE